MRDRERHLIILCLTEHAVPRTRENDLALIRLHGPDDDVCAVQPATKRRGQIPTLVVEGRLHQAHHLRGIAKDHHHIRRLKRMIP